MSGPVATFHPLNCHFRPPSHRANGAQVQNWKVQTIFNIVDILDIPDIVDTLGILDIPDKSNIKEDILGKIGSEQL